MFEEEQFRAFLSNQKGHGLVHLFSALVTWTLQISAYAVVAPYRADHITTLLQALDLDYNILSGIFSGVFFFAAAICGLCVPCRQSNQSMRSHRTASVLALLASAPLLVCSVLMVGRSIVRSQHEVAALYIALTVVALAELVNSAASVGRAAWGAKIAWPPLTPRHEGPVREFVHEIPNRHQMKEMRGSRSTVDAVSERASLIDDDDDGGRFHGVSSGVGRRGGGSTGQLRHTGGGGDATSMQSSVITHDYRGEYDDEDDDFDDDDEGRRMVTDDESERGGYSARPGRSASRTQTPSRGDGYEEDKRQSRGDYSDGRKQSHGDYSEKGDRSRSDHYGNDRTNGGRGGYYGDEKPPAPKPRSALNSVASSAQRYKGDESSEEFDDDESRGGYSSIRGDNRAPTPTPRRPIYGDASV